MSDEFRPPFLQGGCGVAVTARPEAAPYQSRLEGGCPSQGRSRGTRDPTITIADATRCDHSDGYEFFAFGA